MGILLILLNLCVCCSTKRRSPPQKLPAENGVDNVLQPFDGSKFNFTKVDKQAPMDPIENNVLVPQQANSATSYNAYTTSADYTPGEPLQMFPLPPAANSYYSDSHSIKIEPLIPTQPMETEPPSYYINYHGSSHNDSKRKASTELESTASKRPKYATDIEIWREHLGIPSIRETGESSGGSYYLPLTGETVEDTVPLLVGQTIFLEDQHSALMDYHYGMVEELEVLKKRSEGEEREAQISRDAIMDLYDHQDEHIAALATHRERFIDLAYEQRILGERMLIEESRSDLAEVKLSTVQDQVNGIIDLLHRHSLW